MQNVVTWGQNMSANIEEFACISMGELFSGVPPYSQVTLKVIATWYSAFVLDAHKWPHVLGLRYFILFLIIIHSK